jgi:hypothetical protein
MTLLVEDNMKRRKRIRLYFAKAQLNQITAFAVTVEKRAGSIEHPDG